MIVGLKEEGVNEQSLSEEEFEIVVLTNEGIKSLSEEEIRSFLEKIKK